MQIQLSMLVSYKVAIIIISSNVTCSRHHKAEQLALSNNISLVQLTVYFRVVRQFVLFCYFCYYFFCFFVCCASL